MGTDRKWKNTVVAVVRWSARVIGVVIAGFFLLMFIGESSGQWHSLLRLKANEAIGLSLMGAYVVAMFLALKWEHVGLLLGLAALGSKFVLLGIRIGFSHKGVLNLFFLTLWLPILLYLLCWVLEGRGWKRTKAVL